MNVRAREQAESQHASAAARQHRGNAVMVWLRVAGVVELQKEAARATAVHDLLGKNL
jgi:hypothetical protein